MVASTCSSLCSSTAAAMACTGTPCITGADGDREIRGRRPNPETAGITGGMSAVCEVGGMGAIRCCPIRFTEAAGLEVASNCESGDIVSSPDEILFTVAGGKEGARPTVGRDNHETRGLAPAAATTFFRLTSLSRTCSRTFSAALGLLGRLRCERRRDCISAEISDDRSLFASAILQQIPMDGGKYYHHHME
jgi:hypothetical protein